MNETVVWSERDEDELERGSSGTTMVLTPTGWEASEYVEPADDWDHLEDGSYRSPDGAIRTWPLGAEISSVAVGT